MNAFKAKISMTGLVLLFSSFCFANVAGSWRGTLSYNGHDCKATTINISTDNNQLLIRAAPQLFIACGNEQFMLDESYEIRGEQLWKYQIKIGNISDSMIRGDERAFDVVEGAFRYWNFVTFIETSQGTLLVHLNFNDSAILSGEFTR